VGELEWTFPLWNAVEAEVALPGLGVCSFVVGMVRAAATVAVHSNNSNHTLSQNSLSKPSAGTHRSPIVPTSDWRLHPHYERLPPLLLLLLLKAAVAVAVPVHARAV
jgi:hypothetical protein